MRRRRPNTPIQALIRGQNLVSNRNFADDTVELFVKHAASCGVDVFRVFDPLNDLRNMETAIAAVLKAKKRVQGALCYAISPAHNIEGWCSLAKGLANMGCHEIVIKDTSGLLSPQATWELVAALKQTVKIPVDVHSHCSSGMAPMAYMAAVEAGADVLDVAMSPLAWGTSQPAAESVVAALQGGEYDTGLDLDRMWEANNALEALKRLHQADISPVADRIDADILRYHMPGLMLEDIYRQLGSHEAGARISEVLDEANRVRLELGYPPLVAPVRQMIATQAVYNVIGGERYATVTQELKDYLQGLYGRPPVAADPELRRLVLGREEPITIRPADLLEPQVEMARAQVRKMGQEPTDDAVLIQLLFPSVAPAYHRRGDEKARAKKTEAPAPVAADPPTRGSAGRRSSGGDGRGAANDHSGVRRRGRWRGLQGSRHRRRHGGHRGRAGRGCAATSAQGNAEDRRGHGDRADAGTDRQDPDQGGRRRKARRRGRCARGDEDAERHRHHGRGQGAGHLRQGRRGRRTQSAAVSDRMNP